MTLIKYFCLLIDSGIFSTSRQENNLRLFELQSLSADAMRIVLDEMPNTFADKIKQYCGMRGMHRHYREKNDLLFRIYAVFYFNILQYRLLIYDFYVGTQIFVKYFLSNNSF